MRAPARSVVIGEILLAAILAFLVAPSLGAALLAAAEWAWPGIAVRSSLWGELVVPLTAQQAALALFGWLGLRRIRPKVRERTGVPLVVRAVGWGFLLLAVNRIAATASVVVASAILGYDRVLELLQLEENPLTGFFSPDSSLPLIAAGLLLVSVTAPISEELFFRGYVYGKLRERFGGRAALWGSALLFAAPHLYFVQFASIFLLGILLAVAYVRNGTLLVPVVAHGVMNGLVALTAFAA